jgi:electron transport complex protein RnfC
MSQLIPLHDYSGGIHPAQNKLQSVSQPIAQAPLPATLVLPLNQHIGAPSDPCVAVGDKVLKGQIIARAKGFVSAPLHAPSSGTIGAIEERAIPHSSGMNALCIVINTDGKDQWIDHQGLTDYRNSSNEEIINAIREAGIAGLGGAGFPTSIKLAPRHDIHTLIINAAECEPFITADDMLMRERADQVIQGIDIVMQLLTPQRCIIGIEDNKPEAIAALNDAVKAAMTSNSDTSANKIIVQPIPTKYPSGGEKQLIQVLTGNEVPHGGLPADIGLVCQNVGTVYAIKRAIIDGEPLISRITTLTGNALKSQGNFEVLIGAPIESLLEYCGYNAKKVSRLIMGGPMMGFTLNDISLPIVKVSNCILAANKKELAPPTPAQACIRCGMCEQACPAGLLPQQLYWFSRTKEHDKATAHNLFDCIECGACSYVCPSNIPLVQYYRHTKGEIKQEKADQMKSDRAKERFEARTARLDAEVVEKEARRAARAEKTAKALAAKAEAAAAAPAPVAPAIVQIDNTDKLAELDALIKKLDSAKARIEKATTRLEEAKASGADTVSAFETGLAKQQEKTNALALEIAAVKKAIKADEKTAPAATEEKPDVEKLEKALATAQKRLDTAKKRLDEATAEGSDIVPALTTGYEKQVSRVADATKALEAANTSGQNTATTEPEATEQPVVDIAALEKKVLAAQSRVDKATERLAMAEEQGLGTIDALKTGLSKQHIKLKDAQKVLATAKAEA